MRKGSHGGWEKEEEIPFVIVGKRTATGEMFLYRIVVEWKKIGKGGEYGEI